MVLMCLCAVEHTVCMYIDIYKVKIRLTLYVCWEKQMAIDDDDQIPRIWNEKPRKKEKLLVQQ